MTRNMQCPNTRTYILMRGGPQNFRTIRQSFNRKR